MKDYIICIFVSIITILGILIYINHQNNKFVVEEEIFNKKLTNNTKCIDCQKNLPLKYKYLSVASKCYDCEKQYLNQNLNPIFTQPSKCFSCL